MLGIIKELCSKNAPSGYEKNVREYIISKLDKDKTTYHEDNIGNLIVTHKGKPSSNRIAFFAPMDEASIIITRITQDGFLKFSSIGISDEVLFSKIFTIGDNKILGNCGGRTWHLSSDAERKNQPSAGNLTIDIGAENKEEAENAVSLGDYGNFLFDFTLMGNDLVSSKALSERMCCAALIKMLNSDIPYEFFGSFTACSKTGTQGYTVSAYALKPDFAFILNACPAGDIPICPKEQIISKLKNGTVISISDFRTVYNRELVSIAIKTAVDNQIPYQIKDKILTAEEAKAVLSSGNGVKLCPLSVPMRYINTPCCTASLSDFDSLTTLSEMLILKLSADSLQ